MSNYFLTKLLRQHISTSRNILPLSTLGFWIYRKIASQFSTNKKWVKPKKIRRWVSKRKTCENKGCRSCKERLQELQRKDFINVDLTFDFKWILAKICKLFYWMEEGNWFSNNLLYQLCFTLTANIVWYSKGRNTQLKKTQKQQTCRSDQFPKS